MLSKTPRNRLLHRTGKIQFFLDNRVCDELPIDYEDPFTLDDFDTMISQHEKVNKKFIIARVQTRDKVNVLSTHFSYYGAWSLNKLIFKRRGTELVHRYHRTTPITSMNPLNNLEIVGEVYYFEVENNYSSVEAQFTPGGTHLQVPASHVTIELPGAIPPNPEEALVSHDNSLQGEPSSVRSRPTLVNERAGMVSERTSLLGPGGSSARLGAVSARQGAISSRQGATSARQGATSAREGEPGAEKESLVFRANFIGTDYNFANSAPLREVFARNYVVDETAVEAATAAAAAAANGGTAVPSAPTVNPANPGAGGRRRSRTTSEIADRDVVAVLSHLTRFRESTFMYSQIIDVPYSRALIFGAIATLYCLVIFIVFGLGVLHLMSPETEKVTYWYFSLLPFLSFMNDRLICALFRANELRPIIVMKMAVWGFYVLFPLILFSREKDQSYWLARDVLDVVCPALGLVYSTGFYIVESSTKKLI